MSDLLRFDALAGHLASMALGHWIDVLEPFCQSRLSSQRHGDFDRWHETVLALESAEPGDRKALLLELAPWRKGPFQVGGVDIDSEWRSDLKWSRLANDIEPLDGRRVLDIGCGNGYYALQMRKAGAGLVVGVDPTVLFFMQFAAVNIFERDPAIFVLPLRLEELPPANGAFDTTFSMGVLYHQRAPIDHLRQLCTTLRPGGQLVLETIFVPGEESYACTPPDRYARMRNVWLLPTIAELETWLRRSGFGAIEIVDKSITTTTEQRSTEWMPFESLREALDPNDPSRTVEGWPAPHRVVVTATRPKA